MTLTHVPVAPLPLARFQTVLDAPHWQELDDARQRTEAALRGRVVWNVNSTAFGGGVAEMLRSLLAYARGAGVDARWVVLDGTPEFFRLTKRLHNRLHGHSGDGGPLGAAEQRTYEEVLRTSAADLHALARPGDVVILHDPQTAGLIPALLDGVRVVWRSHIGRDGPDAHADEAWAFLLPYLRAADGWIFSRREYVPPGLDPTRVTIVPPSIDAFTPKNQELDGGAVLAILHAAGLLGGPAPFSRPAFARTDGTPGRVDRRADLGGGDPIPAQAPWVTQVSRWDALKDPIGVLEGFVEHVAPSSDAHLILAGPAVEAVADDPEGAAMLTAVRVACDRLPPSVRSRVHLACLPMDDAEENAAIVNALQRRSDVVVQKSLAEGFGLTVGEAMWKRRPVVASAVGGIRDQIEDGISGRLIEDPSDLRAFGEVVLDVLSDAARAEAMGAAAHERVRDHFLSSRHLVQYARLLGHLAGPDEPAAAVGAVAAKA